MNWKLVFIAVVSFLLLTAGCLRTEPGRGADVGFRGTMNATDSKFVVDGRVTLGGGVPEQDVFHDVTIYFFAENGSLLDSHRVGNLTGFVEVSTTTERVPYYVVINSPDFWEEPRIVVSYYYRVGRDGDRDYAPRDARSKDDFPVTLPAMNVTHR